MSGKQGGNSWPPPPPSALTSGAAKGDGETRSKVFIALIGVLGVIIGGVISFGSGYIGAGRQADSAADLSRAEYLRTEQKAAYVAFISAAAAFRQQVYDYQLDDTVAFFDVNMRPAQEKLSDAATSVYLVGSSHAFDEANHVLEAATRQAGAVQRLALARQAKDTAMAEDWYDRVANGYDDFDEHVQSFKDSAKGDLTGQT